MFIDSLLRSQFGKPSGWLGSLFMGPILNIANVRLVNTAIELLDLRPKDSVLDIGFGGGYSLCAMAARITRGTIAGVDYSPEMVERAAREIEKKRLAQRVSVKCGDVAKLPFPNATFNKVLTVNSLYYWSDMRTSLREIARVMKRGGRVAVAFRSKQSLRPLTRGWEGFSLYDPEEFADILRAARFELICVEHRDSWWVLDTVVVVAEWRRGS